LKILLVEDEEHDAFFMHRALAKASLPAPAHVAVNGQDALDYLSGTGQYSDRTAFPFPNCVFLDLKLPFVHGFQVLEWIRGQAAFPDLPVFVLSSSDEDSDRKRAERLGAKGYLVKPPTVQALLEALNLVQV